MGHHNLRFSGDPHSQSGFWGPPTSAPNFCEEDYAVTRYVAEFINTVTNLAYIYLALRHPRRRSRSSSSSSGEKAAGATSPPPKGLDVLSASLLAVGVASAAFHGTLRRGPQLCDDLSMLALAAALLGALYARGRSSPGAARIVAALVAAAASAASAAYVRSGQVLHHVYIFAAMLTLIWPRTLYLIYHHRRRRHHHQSGGSREEERRMMMRRFWKAVALLLGAYAIWNADLELCWQLRALRGRLGLPWAWLLELHGWWHVLTAVGASEYIQLVRELCQL